MRLLVTLAVVIILAGCRTPVDRRTTALAVADEIVRLAESTTMWPGFDPMATPLAIFDGTNTFLLRHPSPPREFPVYGSDAEKPSAGIRIYEGRHPAVTANTSVEIGGFQTATIMFDADSPDNSVTKLAAMAIHEAFHVFQSRNHPEWPANEADLFVYPVDDTELLTLRRMEIRALDNALRSLPHDGIRSHANSKGATSDKSTAGAGLARSKPIPEATRCWAAAALALRGDRYASMDERFAAYERGTELNEGLATYVELVAARGPIPKLPADGFGPTEIRPRGYAVGAGLALLLDAFSADWKQTLEQDHSQSLDALLRLALDDSDVSRATPTVPEFDRAILTDSTSGSCGFSASEMDSIRQQADAAIATLQSERVRQRSAFDARDGWRVTVEADASEPLWPQRFDPLNVGLVSGGLLHTRMLRLGNGSGEFEALDDSPDQDIDALTEGLGPHPLFNGVLRAVVNGLEEPTIEQFEDSVSVQAPGFSGSFSNARVTSKPGQILIQLEAPSND